MPAADPAQQAVDYEFARKAGVHLRHAAERKAWPRLAEYADLIDALATRLHAAEEARDRLLYIAEHLFQMVTPEQWRDTGGDDGQGHYEGDYRAEQLRDELARFVAVQPGGDTEGGA